MSSINDLKKLAKELSTKKAQVTYDDVRMHLIMIEETLNDLKSKLGVLEDVEEDLNTLHGLAEEFYRERPIAKLIGLDSNPFHAFLGIGKVADGKAGEWNLSAIVHGLKRADHFIEKAEDLMNQVPVPGSEIK